MIFRQTLKGWIGRQQSVAAQRTSHRNRAGLLTLETIEERMVPSAVVTTDKPDYSPNSVATITAGGFQPGETIEFHVAHTDNTYHNVYPAWDVTDGGSGDLDEQVNGSVSTTWQVGNIPNSQLQLTADGLTSGEEAVTSFTDSTIILTVTMGAQNGNVTDGFPGEVSYPLATSFLHVGSAQVDSANYTIAFTGGTPSGVTSTFIPNPVNSGSTALRLSTLNIDTDATTPAGSYPFVVTVKDSNNITLTANGTLTVDAAGQITGTVYLDLNGNGTFDSGEPGLVDRTVFLDVDNNGQFNAGDVAVETDSDGNYDFGKVAPGTYTIRELLFGSDTLTEPTIGNYTFTTGTGTYDVGNFGMKLQSSDQPFPISPPIFVTTAPDANTAFVTNLYHSLLGREPDAIGLGVWVDRLNAGASQGSVVSGFLNGTEYLGNLVDSYYENFLGRPADTEGQAYWVGKLQLNFAGIPGGLSPEQVAGMILTSPEANSLYVNNNDFVQKLYRSLLGREGSTDEIKGYVLGLNSGGVSRLNVVNIILYSTESANRIINNNYVQFLHRLPVQADLDGFTSAFQGGTISSTGITYNMLATGEFYTDSEQAIV